MSDLARCESSSADHGIDNLLVDIVYEPRMEQLFAVAGISLTVYCIRLFCS
jgi:hypothetical protein